MVWKMNIPPMQKLYTRDMNGNPIVIYLKKVNGENTMVARTPEYIANIQARWDRRKLLRSIKKLETKNNNDKRRI